MAFLPIPELGTLAVLTFGLFVLAMVNAAAAFAFRVVARKRNAQQISLRAVWEPAITRHLTANKSADAVHQLVDFSRQAYFVSTLVEFARRVEGDDHERICQLAKPYLPAIQRNYFRRSPATRAEAVQTLGELGWPEYAATIVQGLDDRAPLVAMVAAQALCHPRSGSHANRVVARLDRFSSWTPVFLASMLANTGPSIRRMLHAALADTSRPSQVRVAAAEALRRLNDFDAADVAAGVLVDETDHEVLAAVLRLIGTVGRSSHTPTIARFMNSEDFVLRMSAADAIAELGGPTELQQLRRVVMQDPSQWVALHAARSLLKAGWREELRELAESDHPRGPVAAQVLAEVRAR